jgi:UDP-glucuronate 4-epimerase
MHLLITGASGQIGTNLALRCIASGHTVSGVDVRPNLWSDQIPTLIHDLAVAALPSRTFTRPDVVVHLAAHAKVHQSVEQPARAHENVQMTHHVLEYCRGAKIPLIYSSSREVYGNVQRHTTSENDADFLTAASPYSASKIACESAIYAYARCYGLRYLVFRLSNVYGRYDNDSGRMERVIPLFIDRLRRGEPITLYGADKVLDFTHVDDCIDGLVAGIDRLVQGTLGHETINVAGGAGHSLAEMAALAATALGVDAKIKKEPIRVGEITRYVANIDKARALLDFSPRMQLPTGIVAAVQWNTLCGNEFAERSGKSAAVQL